MEGYQFYHISFGISSVYLMPCTDGYLLVDTASPGIYPRFQKAMRQLNVEPEQIRYLFLTHHHADHTGFAARLIEQSGCRVIAHQKAAPLLTSGKSGPLNPVNQRIGVVVSVMRRLQPDSGYPPLPLNGSSILLTGDDPDLLQSIGVDGIILHTPGHTADSISIVLENGNSLVGDAAANFPAALGAHHRPLIAENPDALFASWQKLLANGARHIYPSHGKPFSADRLNAALEYFSRR